MNKLAHWIVLTSLLALLPKALAGFSATSSKNVAVYWGQNSAKKNQQRLSHHCANSKYNIIPIAFLISLVNPTLNLASAGDICTTIPGSDLFYCAEVEADIKECQTRYGKTILLSIGGATYDERDFTTPERAVSVARNIWLIFGPKTAGNDVPRPFGDAAIDGFDLDFENPVFNMPEFANELRRLMDAKSISSGKKYLLTAAPQCLFPDAANWPMLDGSVYFDAVFVQFYNNLCGLHSFVPGSTQKVFNFETWDDWAKTKSKNKNVKVMLGVPASKTAAGSGYVSGNQLDNIISHCKKFTSFGGVMVWDATQMDANTGFLDSVSAALGDMPPDNGSAAPPATTSIPTAPIFQELSASVDASLKASTTQAVASPIIPIKVKVVDTTPTPATDTTLHTPVREKPLINQWHQCGGKGWNGGTVCKAPFKCRYVGAWYSQCK